MYTKYVPSPIEPTKLNTALTQQWTILRDSLDKESIASLTITHLEIFISKLTKLNYHVILVIDANEAFKSNAGDIARLFKKCNLIDTISTKHGTAGEPNIYARGSDLINYFACTSEIYKFITKCGILPFCTIMTSDYRGLYLDIDIIQYLRNPFINLAKNNNRLLSSTHPKKVSEYKEVLIKYISARKVTDKTNAIQKKINNKSLNESDMKEINNIDITFTQGALFSKNELKKDLHNSPWSLELEHRIMHLSYWRLVVSQILTKNFSHADRLQTIIKELPTTFNTSYLTIPNAFKNKTIARKN